ncbi:hypothetical protein BDZ45DRAFT_737117 [Acephala macrosclerotiorum]|nr:hypothetical protein BDZ45DRAFT_737117 [Acephala macrosclerotiorum]
MSFSSLPLVCLLTFFSFFLSFATSHLVQSIANVKTRADQLESSYDYITVGGGTSGLTVADRLTEDGTKTVLVLEYGPLSSNPPCSAAPPFQGVSLNLSV